MVSKELDIVNQCIEMIEQETVGLFDTDLDLSGAHIEELLKQDEAPLEKSLDRLLIDCKVPACLVEDFVAGQDQSAHVEHQQEQARDQHPQSVQSIEGSSGSARGAAPLDMASIAAMLGTLYQEASTAVNNVSPPPLLSAGPHTDEDAAEEARSIDGGRTRSIDGATESSRGGSTKCSEAADQEMVEALKRKLSMLTVGIRFLHTQIEEKSLQLLGDPEIDLSLGTPDTVRLERDSRETPSTDTSACMAPMQLLTQPSPKKKAADPPSRQASDGRRPGAARGGLMQPPTVSTRAGRQVSQRGGSLNRSDRQSLRQQQQQRENSPPRQREAPVYNGVRGDSTRGSLGRRARQTPRDPVRDQSPPRNKSEKKVVERMPSARTASTVDRISTPRPHASDRCAQETPRCNPPTSARSRAQRERESRENNSPSVHLSSVDTSRQSDAHGPQAGRSSRASPRRLRSCSPGSSRANSPARDRPRSRSPDRRTNSQHPGSWTPPMQLGPNFENGDVGESELPFGWRNLVSEAYREVTGRPMVDRIRLLESSSASGRRSDTDVFWLHTMVRWGDMRLVESRRCPERGEDLTLFVVHSYWRPPVGYEDIPSEERHASPRRRRHKSGFERIWDVANVRVLNSLSSVDDEGTGETAEFIGRLGAILLYDALGPLLADDYVYEEAPPDSPKEQPHLVDSADRGASARHVSPSRGSGQRNGSHGQPHPEVAEAKLIDKQKELIREIEADIWSLKCNGWTPRGQEADAAQSDPAATNAGFAMGSAPSIAAPSMPPPSPRPPIQQSPQPCIQRETLELVQPCIQREGVSVPSPPFCGPGGQTPPCPTFRSSSPTPQPPAIPAFLGAQTPAGPIVREIVSGSMTATLGTPMSGSLSVQAPAGPLLSGSFVTPTAAVPPAVAAALAMKGTMTPRQSLRSATLGVAVPNQQVTVVGSPMPQQRLGGFASPSTVVRLPSTAGAPEVVAEGSMLSNRRLPS